MFHNCNSNEILELSNKDIISFYKARPHIDIEQSQLLLIDFLAKWEKCVKNTDVTEVAHETTITNSSSPNTICIETKKSTYKDHDTLEFILNKLNPTSKIVSNKNSNICCDYIITANNSTKLLIENKILDQNVSEIVVDMFKKSCQTNYANGILMSQNTGIIGKEDFEIEIIGSNVIVYLHLVNYDECKIHLAINMLNRVHDEVISANANSNNTISDATLNEIKVEYQKFINNKEDLQIYIKNTHSAIVNKLENIKLSNMGEYLSTKFTQVDKPKLYKCNFCDFYTSNTLKGMAAHKRGCKKKYPNINQSTN
jgi:uncharacterized protein with FMN-binding domain